MCISFAVSEMFSIGRYEWSGIHMCTVSLHVDESGDPLVIYKVTLSPDPPVKGKNLTISLNYNLRELVPPTHMQACTQRIAHMK